MPNTRTFKIKDVSTFGEDIIEDEAAWLGSRPTVTVTVTPSSESSNDQELALQVINDLKDLTMGDWAVEEVKA